MKYSVVIPLFNEAENLKLLQERLNRVLEKITSDYEIIYVNDKSTDNSLEVLIALKNIYPQIKIINLPKRSGQSQALFWGLRLAQGDWIITLDSDLQNPPEEIEKLVSYQKDFDFITGVRQRRKDNLLRILSSAVAYFMRYIILGDKTKDTGCSLRVFRREILEVIPLFVNFHRFFVYLVRKSGYRIKEVPVKHERRIYGKSKYGIFNRLFCGIFDLWGIFWLKKRLFKKINYQII